MEKIVIVDLDDTLFIQSPITRFLLKLSRFFYKYALLSETLSEGMKKRLEGFDRIIILSGRSKTRATETTLRQLRRYKIKAHKVILCNREKVILDWKRRTVNKIKRKHKNIIWFDDIRGVQKSS